MTSHALIDALASGPLDLAVEPAPGSPRMQDPTVVAAFIDTDWGSLDALIGSLMALAVRDERTKLIVQAASGRRLEVSATAGPEQMQTFIAAARGLDVVHLHLAAGAG